MSETTEHPTLAEFLLERIAEDKDEAQYALKYAILGDDLDHEWKWVHFYKPKTRKHGWSSSHHEGAPTPARVLAECEAKRRIVELHGRGVDPCDAHNAAFESVDCETLSLLALPYVDHPDYDKSWRS